MIMTYHLSVDIQGILKSKKKIKGLCDENGKTLNDTDARNLLWKIYGEGYKVLPIGDACEGFNFQGNGCPGHEKNEVNNGE